MIKFRQDKIILVIDLRACLVTYYRSGRFVSDRDKVSSSSLSLSLSLLSLSPSLSLSPFIPKRNRIGTSERNRQRKRAGFIGLLINFDALVLFLPQRFAVRELPSIFQCQGECARSAKSLIG